MSDVEVTHAEQASRADTARVLAALADALAGDGKVELTLGSTTIQVHVPDAVRCKVEVEIDRDELEFEIELRWSTSPPPKKAVDGEVDHTDATAVAEGAPAPKRARAR
jgi:amphi-Trp domain-containing protein